VTPAQLLAYLGPALIYALVATALVFGLLRAATAGRTDGWRPQIQDAWAIGLVAFFLILTQHPFPDRATLDCSQGGAPPILQPFATLSRLALLWDRGGGLRPWIADKVVQASAMNFVLCLLIGLAIARHLRGRLVVLQAFACGAALSLTAEVLQLTGLLGFYPCPYRQFEVDDLILNIGGVMAGVALARLFRRRPIFRKRRTLQP
jgi:hypothetical protein